MNQAYSSGEPQKCEEGAFGVMVLVNGLSPHHTRVLFSEAENSLEDSRQAAPTHPHSLNAKGLLHPNKL